MQGGGQGATGTKGSNSSMMSLSNPTLFSPPTEDKNVKKGGGLGGGGLGGASLGGEPTPDRHEEYIESFPEFVLDYLLRMFGQISSKIVCQRAWDLVHMIETYRSEFVLIKIFGFFLSKTYSHQDLLFFLFVRRCVEREQSEFAVQDEKHARRNSLWKSTQDTRPLRSNSWKAATIQDPLIPTKVRKLFDGRLIGGVSSAFTRSNPRSAFLTIAQCYAVAANIFNANQSMKEDFLRKLKLEIAALEGNQDNIAMMGDDDLHRIKKSAQNTMKVVGATLLFPAELIMALALQHYYEEKQYLAKMVQKQGSSSSEGSSSSSSSSRSSSVDADPPGNGELYLGDANANANSNNSNTHEESFYKKAFLRGARGLQAEAERLAKKESLLTRDWGELERLRREKAAAPVRRGQPLSLAEERKSGCPRRTIRELRGPQVFKPRASASPPTDAGASIIRALTERSALNEGARGAEEGPTKEKLFTTDSGHTGHASHLVFSLLAGP